MRTNKLIFDSYFMVTLNLDHTYPSFYSYTLVDLDPNTSIHQRYIISLNLINNTWKVFESEEEYF